jgi:dihydroxyacetone kinase phosphoprotein-dependent L subunit
MDTLSLAQVELIIKTMADTAVKNEAYFSELDGVMGDADFGISLADGFRAIMKGWDSFDRADIGSFLSNVASTMMANTGGCSGTVWGTLFKRCAVTFKGKAEITIDDIIAGLKSAMESITQKGGAVPGDKTLLDALDDIVKALELNKGGGLLEAFKKASGAAVETRERTKQWTARRGRQSFTGDRSIGTYDPGIVAVGDMTVAIIKALGA